jgi:putative redox protein
METENHHQELESASATLMEGMHFVGAIDDVRIDLDAEANVGGTGGGPQPHRLLLLAMASCTAMDVISILRKKRQQVSGLRVDVQGSRAAQHPRVYTPTGCATRSQQAGGKGSLLARREKNL